ncbi:MAG: hypothetical protein LBE13_05980 [Bacteroidales bacterium]|nr:hypothetical protein [Bacteroidales bacterium]
MHYSFLDVFSAGIWILLVLLYALICGGFSSWLAGTKGYGKGAWFGLGFLFGVFALFAIGAAPLRQQDKKITAKKNKTGPIKISKNIDIGALEPGTLLKVIAFTVLREEPGSSTKALGNLWEGNRLRFIKIGESTTEDGITAPWLFVETGEGERGYCFSNSLEKV